MATAGKTSLASQLERLKLPQTSAHRETHGTASFLYDFFEAKTIDAETHYSVAVEGLESLAATVNDPAVAAFRETLFSESSKTLDRGVLSAERNAAIDALLEEYLYRVVSRYFALTDTHRTIEWLLYRYRVNEYNTEALIGSVLPYHETRHFVRLLQTVSAVKNPRNSLWSWLKPIQESGVPLTKSVLLGYCTRPTGLEFIRFITDAVFKGTAVDGAGVTFPSFLTSFCVNLLEKTFTASKTNNSNKSEQAVLLMIISVVSKAMRSSKAVPQLFVAAYLIFAHCCTTTLLQADVVESFLGSLLKRLKSSGSGENFESVLMALTIVVHSQALTKLPAKYLNDELVANLVAVISNTSSSNKTKVSFEPLLRCLLLTVIDNGAAKLQLTSANGEESASSTTSFSITLERYKAYCNELLLADNVRQHLTRDTVFALVKAVNGAVEKHQQQQGPSEAVDELLTHLLKTLQTACPVWLEQAIDLLVVSDGKENNNAGNWTLLLRFHHSLLSSGVLAEASSGGDSGIITENLEPEVEGSALCLLIEKLLTLKPHEMTAELVAKVLQAMATEELDSSTVTHFNDFLLKVLRFREKQTKKQSISLGTSVGALPWHLVNREVEQSGQQLKLSGFQLYCLLLEYTNTAVSKKKKVAKMCRGLLSSLVEGIVAEAAAAASSNSSAFAFFLPIIANSAPEFTATRTATLSLLTSLFAQNSSENTSAALIASLQAHPQYLIAYLCALASPMLEVRQHALENCRAIGEWLNNNKGSSSSSKSNHLQSFSKTIVEGEEEVLVSGGGAAGRLVASTSLNGLIVRHLTELLIDQAWAGKLSGSLRVSLLGLLAAMGDVESKAAVFKYYYSRLFERSSAAQTKVMLKGVITADEEKELMALLASLNIDQEGLFVEDQEEEEEEEEMDAGGDRHNYVCALYQAAIELPATAERQGQQLSFARDSLFGLYHFLTKANFDRLRALNPPFALQLIVGMLRVQLTLSETTSSLTTSDSSFSSDTAALSAALKTRLRRLNTDGDLITAVLQRLLPIEKVRNAFGYASGKSAAAAASEGPTLAEKRLRSSSGGPSPSPESKFTVAWKMLRIYMTAFQSKASIENAGVLMRTLFDYLRLTFMELGDNSAEYTRQTLLYTVANCVKTSLGEETKKKKRKSKDLPDSELMEIDEPEKAETGGSGTLPPELAAFNVDIIVDCMRESRVRETQKLALLLLGQVAAYFRRPILDYLVEIFTFIGTSLLQCDNQYSLQILFETLEAVVPIVLESKGKLVKKTENEPSIKVLKEKKVTEEEVKEEEEDMSAYVVSIFVKAFPDVPSYRRLPLFSKLIHLLGERQYLPVVSVRLLEEAVVNKSRSSRADREVVQSFLLALLGTFPPKTQLEALCTLLALFDSKFFDHHLKRGGGKSKQGKAGDQQLVLVSSSKKKKKKKEQSTDGDQSLKEFTAASEAICGAFTSHIAFDSDKATCGVEILRLVVALISSSPFVDACRGGGGAAEEGLADSALLIHMLNQLLEMIVSLGEGSSVQMKPTLVAYRRRIKATLDEALLKYHRLLSSRRLIEIVTKDLLPQRGSPSDGLVMRKALELLNEKLLKMGVEELAPKLALKVLRSLSDHIITERKQIEHLDELALHNLQLTVAAVKFATRFIQGSQGTKRKQQQIAEDDADDDEDQRRQKQNEVLSKLLGKVGQMTAAIEVVEKRSKGDEDLQPLTSRSSSRCKSLQTLKGTCLLTLTQLLVSMSLDGLGHLGTVVELVLANLEEVLRGHKQVFHLDDVLLLSNICALNKLLSGVSGFAAFLSQKHLRSILLHLLEVATVAAEQVNGVRSKLAACWALLARQVPKRALFEAIDAVYEETVAGLGPQAVVELMSLFRLACDSLQRTEVEQMVKSFKDFMIKALEYRSRVSDKEEEKVDLATIETIETAFGEAFSAFIPKLNEATFRPIFYCLLEWALRIEGAKKRKKKSGGGGGVYLADVHYHRMIAFYRFTSLLADRLKSLFCVFVAPSVVGNASEMLAAYHSDNVEDEQFGGGSQKMQVDSFVAVEEKSSSKKAVAEQLKLRDPRLGEPLVGAILSTLSKCFLYDLNGAFVNKDVTSMIVKPIVNQISNLFGTAADFESRLGLILQCTQYLIQNNKDEALIKEFNYQILLKTREANEKVRVGAIKVLHRLILTCSEDYLPFIPEAIPFIAELSEDDAESVEAAVKKLIVDIEQLVGEPINKYL